MAASPDWRQFERKLVAILRGVTPDTIVEITTGLIEAGFRAVEVPLNSPDPFLSIERAVRAGEAAANAPCLIGAGTVLTAEDARRVADVGGNLAVAPNMDPAVIRAAADAGMTTMPGVFTPTEALAALAHGADALKFFPASVLGAKGIRAIAAVLPADVETVAVGGVGDGDFETYLAVGIRGFGLGSSLYKPGDVPSDVVARGRAAVAAFDRAAAGIVKSD